MQGWQYPPWAHRHSGQKGKGSGNGGKGKDAGGKGKAAKGSGVGDKGKYDKGSVAGKGKQHWGSRYMDDHGGVYVQGGYICRGVFYKCPALQILIISSMNCCGLHTIDITLTSNLQVRYGEVSVHY